jgi:long-chain acyl-CoA synthetase
MEELAQYLLNECRSLGEAFRTRCTHDADETVYFTRPPSLPTSSFFPTTYAGLCNKVAALAVYLLQEGFLPGDKAVIIANTRPEWSITDMAILTLGGVTISVYPSSPPLETGFIIYESQARWLFVENEEQLLKVEGLIKTSFTIPSTELHDSQTVSLPPVTIVTFEKIESRPSLSSRSLAEIFDTLSPATLPVVEVNRNDVASIVYTSGTTGIPKGVVQTHGNHLTNVSQALRTGVFGENGTLFLYLPLAHSFARLIHYLGMIAHAKIVFPRCADPRTSRIDLSLVAQDIRESPAQYLPTVPRLLEKVYYVLSESMKEKNLRGLLLRLSYSSSCKVQQSLSRSEKITPFRVRFVHQITSSIRARVKAQAFGDYFVHAISGGSALPPHIAPFFSAFDIPIYEGYGLTETCVATHVNRPGQWKIGTVGTAFPEVETRINDDGEILIRGKNVAKEYLHRPSATRAAWDSEGYFHTGDLGLLDTEGYLTITGRKKELIITAGGKKVVPLKVEGLIQGSPLVTSTILCGEGKPYCIALLAPNHDACNQVLGKKATEDEVKSLLQDVINKTNQELASFEQVKKFLVLPEEPSIENGLLTPTLKVKRAECIKRYAALIDALYSSTSS